MPNKAIKSIGSQEGRSRKRVVAGIFRNEDTVFSNTLKKYRHDKSFFISMAKKAGIYDAAGNLESSYKR